MKYIKQFQKEHGLIVDGIVGKNTLIKFSQVYKLSYEQTAHVMGQICHETGLFTKGIENLNYRAESLLKTFKKYFKDLAHAKEYEKQPVKIGNYVYANRNGNGDVNSCDGYRFLGRGGIMLTGRKNYKAFSDFVSDPNVLTNPDIVESKYFWETALFYFTAANLMSVSNKVNEQTILTVSKTVNGGYNGIKERIKYTNKFYDMLVIR